MLRGVLVTAIFKKTTEISIIALGNSAAVTLMSTDVERIVRGLKDVNELWASVIQITLATWLLQREIGLACLAPLVVSGLSAAVTIKLSTLTKKRQMLWVKEIQNRVGITSTMLGSMKGIKMSGLTQKMSELIGNLRINEVQVAKKFRHLNVFGATLGYVPVMVSPCVTFAIFTVIALRDNTSLDVSRMFTSLSLILLLTQPLFYVFIGIEELMASIGCFERIGKFLMSEARKDHRLMLSSAQLDGQSQPPSRGSSGVQGEMNDGIELVNLNPRQRGLFSLSNITSSLNADETPAIMASSGTFGWTENGDPTLHDINLSIPRSKLTILVGPVASGKSTLLKALLGEVLSSKGFVHVSSREIAWCEQTPWLINASVQRNIIGFSNFETDLYKAVVFACDLEEDLSQFPDGDQTLVGSKGITLSGGQKHRIAIARAVYSKKEIAMFDDIFSGLDYTTKSKVFGRLFGSQGLLRRRGTTVVIATHAVNLLPHADHIIVLGNGTVVEQGTLVELNAQRGYVHNSYLEHANDSNATEADANPTTENPYKLAKKQDGTSGAGLPSGKERQRRDLSVYAYYFRSIGGKYACIFLVFEALWAFFSTFPPVWLKWWTDANSSQPSQQTGRYLGVYTALQITGLLSHAALVWFCFNLMVQKSGIKLHDITLGTVMRAPMAFFSSTDTGSITTRFSQDIQLIDTQLPLALMCVVSYIFICAAQAVLIASATFYIALSFPALLCVFYLVQKFYLRTSRQLRFLDLEEKAPVYTQFLETLAGLATIRAFAWEAPSELENHGLVNRSQKPFYLLSIGQRWLTLVLDLITCAMAVLVVAVAVKMRGAASAGFTGVALTQLISFTANMKLLIAFWTQLETSIGAVARIKQFEADTADENLPEEEQEPPEDWPSRGEIVFENVSASYGSENGAIALDNISLSIKAGERVGICGRTGSGKSSLLLALLRMLDPQQGRITIDGLPLRSIPLHHLRTRVIVIPQEDALFFLPGSTIRQNLNPYSSSSDNSNSNSNHDNRDEAQDELYISTLKKLNLWSTLSQKGIGLDTPLFSPSPYPSPSSPTNPSSTTTASPSSSPESLLSHGQKQLFSLARAVIRSRSPFPPSAAAASSSSSPSPHPSSSPRGGILVLDEATSATDAATDALMQRVIRESFPGFTILAVAHRVEGLRDFGRVVVLEGGRVVEERVGGGIERGEGVKEGGRAGDDF